MLTHPLLKRNAFWLLCACAPWLSAAPLQPIAPDVIADRFRSLSFDNQRLAGVLADRIRANSEGFLDRLDPQRLTSPYRKGAAAGSSDAASAQAAGLFLYAAAGSYEYRGDAGLRQSMDTVARQLASAQEPDGYLGAASQGERGNPTDLAAQRANLLGLLAYYRVTGEEPAYVTAQKIGDRLVKVLHPAPKEATGPAGEEPAQPGLPQTGVPQPGLASLIGPLVELYRYTAETNYLELARAIAKQALREEDVNVGRDAATVEGLSGLVELFRATGDTTYLRRASQGWSGFSRQSNTVTGVPAREGQSSLSNCLTFAWLDLTLNLLQVTGQPQFGQALETMIYNQVLAGQDLRNGNVCAATALEGKKAYLSSADGALSPCAMAEAAALAQLPEAIWARWGKGIAINLYSGGRGTFQLRRRALVQVYVEASYPQRGDMMLHVDPSRTARFPLRLRVPRWAESFTIDVGASHLLGKPGEFLLLDREWKRGDVVKLSIQMPVQAHEAGDRVAIQRGPELLVLPRGLNGQIQDLAAAAVQTSDSGGIHLTAGETELPRSWTGEEAYKAPGEYEKKTISLMLAPFADANDFVLWLRQTRVEPPATRPSE